MTFCASTLPYNSSAAHAEIPTRRLGSFVRIDPLSGRHWDQIIDRHPDATIFHTSAWAKVLAETYGYTPYYFAASDSTGSVVACLAEVNSWVTGKRGISLPFTDQCSILRSDTCDDDVDAFRHSIETGAQMAWRSIEFRGATESANRGSPPLFVSHSLSLDESIDRLFRRFESSVRRAVRKAERSCLEVDLSTNLEAVKTYYQLHCKTRRKHGAPPQPFRFFKEIHRQILSEDRGFVVIVKRNGISIAGGIFLQYKNRAEYKFGASDPAYEEFRPNNLVMWTAIKQLVERQAATLCFGRTSSGNAGLRRYKLNWGATEQKLFYTKWSYHEKQYVNCADYALGLQNAFFKRCPLTIARAIGAFTYRHFA